jgi:hypothetical protein
MASREGAPHIERHRDGSQFRPPQVEAEPKAMSQRSVLILAALLTAFSLVVAGAVAGGFWSSPASSTAVSTADTPQQPLASGVPVPAEVVAQREAAWRALVDEANVRIKAQQEAIVQLRLLGAKELPPVPEAAALVVARSRAPQAQVVRGPELVTFQGKEAWEVTLSTGTVYVDAATALVLHDGTAQPAPRLRRGGEHEEREHHQRKAWAQRDDDEDDDD